METKKEEPKVKKLAVVRLPQDDYSEHFKNLPHDEEKNGLLGEKLHGVQTNGEETDEVKKTTNIVTDTPRHDTGDPLYSPVVYPPVLANQPSVLANEPKLPYIRNYFKGEYPAYLHAYRQEFQFQLKSGKKERDRTAPSHQIKSSILALFEKDEYSEAYFKEADASPFCRCVREVIMEFEQKYMEYNKPSHQGPLWENCHEYLFFIKYLCKKAAELKNDTFLACAVSDIKDIFEEATSPSNYHNLKNGLKKLTEERQSGKCATEFSMTVDGNLVAEKNRFVDNSIALRELQSKNTMLQKGCEALKKKFDEQLNEQVNEKVKEQIKILGAELRAELLEQKNNTIERSEQRNNAVKLPEDWKCTIL